jgi:hypothetical protein
MKKSSMKKEPSLKIAEKENKPNLTVPTRGKPTAYAPPKDNEDPKQHDRKIDDFRYFCSPDGYPTVINDPEGITKEIAFNPFFETGVKANITERSGVLGMGTHWMQRAERAASWRQQHALRDRRYAGAYVDPNQNMTGNYYNAKPMKRDDSLKKKGPYQQFINGVSYIPKALILREQPALKLFHMKDDDPRQPSMEDLENDRKDPYYNTVANNLTNTRSYPVRTQIGNELTQTRGAVNKLNKLRYIRQEAPYGEGIGVKSWALKPQEQPKPMPQMMPHDLAQHRKGVMMNGINPHALKNTLSQMGMGVRPSTNP